MFRASGVGNIQCGACGRTSTVKQLKAAHAELQTSQPIPHAEFQTFRAIPKF
jgi:hypothetical protein